ALQPHPCHRAGEPSSRLNAAPVPMCLTAPEVLAASTFRRNSPRRYLAVERAARDTCARSSTRRGFSCTARRAGAPARIHLTITPYHVPASVKTPGDQSVPSSLCHSAAARVSCSTLPLPLDYRAPRGSSLESAELCRVSRPGLASCASKCASNAVFQIRGRAASAPSQAARGRLAVRPHWLLSLVSCHGG